MFQNKRDEKLSLCQCLECGFMCLPVVYYCFARCR